MDIRTPHCPPWGPGRRGPTGDRILQGKVRWRHEKDLNRLLRGLVQIGGATAAQAAHPDSRRALGSRTDRLPHMGFGEGGGKQRLRSGSWPLRTPSASMALGRTPLVGAPPPMCTHLPGRQNRSSRAPRAHSPCWIALNPGRAPFWPPRGARRNLRMCFRLIRAVSTRLATQSCIDPAFWAERFWRPGARHARSKTKGAPTRSSLGERGAVPAG
jgi:hypothetical protein